MRRTVITLISYCVLWSSFVYAADPARAQDLPAHKLAEMEPAGHDIVPGYQEQQPINDVIQRVINKEPQIKVNAPQSRVQQSINYEDSGKDYTKDELNSLLQRAKTNKLSLSEEELSILEEYIEDIERQKTSSFKNNNTIGYHHSSRQATDLFFSEYAEGSSSNKYLEIYNGTGADVDLSSYLIMQNSNGGPWDEYVDTLSGTLSNEDVFVIANSSADASILAEADLTGTGICYFNGDDARALIKVSGTDTTILDYIGSFPDDPGSGWEVAGVSDATKDHTLVRKSSVTSGNTSWTAAAGTNTTDSEWTVYDQNVWTYVGSHTMDDDNALSEGFEGTFPPTSWQAISNNTSNSVSQSSTYANTGTYSARFSSFSSASDYTQYLILPKLTIDSGDALTFYHRKYYSWASDAISVGISTTDSSTASFTFGSDLTTGTSFAQHSEDLSSYAGQDIWVAIKYYGSYQYYLYVDDFAGPDVWVNTSPVANISDTSLDFGQVNTSSSSSKTFVVTNSGGSDLTGTIVSDATEFAVSSSTLSVAAGASETITVTYTPSAEGAQSGNVTLTHNGGSSPDIVSVSGTGTTSILVEGFENDAWEGSPSAPPGWSQITVSGSNVWQRYNYSYYAHTGTYSAKGPWASAGGEHLLITSGLDLSDGTDSYKLVFWLDGSSSAGTDLYVQIGSSNSAETDFTDTLASYVAGSNMPSTYAEQSIDLTGYTGTHYLAFRMVDANGYSVYIDDIEVELIPPQPALTLDYSSVSFTPVEIGETASSSSFAVGSNDGAADLVISGVTSSNSDFTVTLNSDTVSSGGDVSLDLSWTPTGMGMSASDIILTHNASTSPDTFQLKGESGHQYVDFNDQSFPSGWSIIDNDTVNGYGYDDGWIFYSSYGPGYGGYYARSHFNTDGADDWMITSKVSVVSGDSIIFRNNSSSSSILEDTLHVYVSTTDNDMASFTTEIGEILSQGYTNIRSAFDLSSYAGSDIYIAIVHHGSVGSNYWSYRKVDDVLLPAKWVNPEAEIVLSDAELDFGGLFAGYGSETATFTISNNGSPDLSITGITSDDDEVTVSPTTATIGYDSTVTFTVTLTAVTASDTGAATLTIASNDAASDGTVSVVWETAAHDLGDFTMSTGLSDAISYGAYPDYIADDANDTISISDPSGLMEHMAIFIDLDHTWMSDLDMTITSPSGESLVFVDGLGGSGDDMLTVVMDGGSNSTAPFFPDAPSSNSLDDFVAGGGADGDWILTITDGAGGDDGTLYSWGIYYTEGESGHIMGSVTDAETGAGLEGVLVSGGNMTYTGSDGSYTMEVLEGELVVDFSKDGFNSVFFTVSVDSGDTVGLDVALTPEVIEEMYSTGFETGDDAGSSSSNANYNFAVMDTMFNADGDTVLPDAGVYMLAYPDTAGATYNNNDLVLWLADSVIDISSFGSIQMSLDANYDTESGWDYFYFGLLLDDGFVYYGAEVSGSSAGWTELSYDMSWAIGLSSTATPAIVFDSDGSVNGYWGGAFDNVTLTGNPFFLAPPTALVAENYGASVPLSWDEPASAGRVSYGLRRVDLANIHTLTRPMVMDENGQMVELVKGPRDYEQVTVDYQFNTTSSRTLSHYNVFRKDWPFGESSLLGTSTTNSYDDTDVTDGDYVDYVVTAVYDEGETVGSNPASARAGLPVVVTDEAFGGEDFEDGFAFENWEQFNSTDAAQWVVGDSAAADSTDAFGAGAGYPVPDHSNFAFISDGRAGDANFESFLVSPFLDFIENHTAIVSLAGYAQVYASSSYTPCYVLVRADMGPWHQLMDFSFDHTSGWGDYSASIGHVVGGSDYVQLAVYYGHLGGYNSGYGNGIAIDDLMLDIIPGPHNLSLAPTIDDVTLSWAHPDSTMNLLRDPVDISANRQISIIASEEDILDLSTERTECYSQGDPNSGWITGFYGPDSGDATPPTFAVLHTFNEGPMELDEVVINGYYNTDDTTTARASIFVGVADLTGTTTDTIATGISFFDISATGNWTDAVLDLSGLSYNATDSTYLKVAWTPLDYGYVALFDAQLWIPGQKISDPNIDPGLNGMSGYDSAGVYTPATRSWVIEVCGTPTPPAISYNVYKDGMVVIDGIEETTWTDENISVVTESCYWVTGLVPMSFDMGMTAVVDELTETDPTNVECATAVNQPPGDFTILSPADGDTIMITSDNLGSSQLFAWSGSTDPNGTQVEYEACFTVSSPFDQFCDDNGTSTAQFVPMADIAGYIDSVNQVAGTGVVLTLSWTVYASDGLAEIEATNGPRSITFDAGFVLSIDEDLLPDIFALHQNYPNPFNPVTTIRFDVPDESHIRMDVYNILGQQVATLVNSTLQPGFHAIRWNGTNDMGKPLASGMYIYKIQAKDFISVKKLVLMK